MSEALYLIGTAVVSIFGGTLRGQKMTMAELSAKLDALLTTNDYPVFRGYKDYLKDRAIKHAQVELALYLKQVAKGTAPERIS